MWGQQDVRKVARAVGSCNSHADTQRGDALTVKQVSILTPTHGHRHFSCVSVKSSIYHSTALLLR